MTSPTPPRWPNPGPDGRLKEKHLPAHLGQTNLNATYGLKSDVEAKLSKAQADALYAPAGSPSSAGSATAAWWPELVGDALYATYIPTGQRVQLDTATVTNPYVVGQDIIWTKGGVQYHRRLPAEPNYRAVTDKTKASIWGSSTAAGLGPFLETMATTDLGVTSWWTGGVGGNRLEQIAARLGSVPATVAAFTIPASGSVSVTVQNVTGTGVGTVSYAGYFEGFESIPGQLSISAGTFTRTTAGTAQAIPAGTKFIPSKGREFRDGVAILNWGKNSLTALVPWQDVLASTITAYEYLRSVSKWVLVVNHFCDTNMTVGGQYMTNVQNYNAALAAQFPGRVVDLNAYVTGSQVWTDTGITPSSTDLTQQGQGKKPTSLSSDDLHLNNAANEAIAKYLIKPALVHRGWYDATLTPPPVTPQWTTVATDDFNRADGALGTTTTGGRTWSSISGNGSVLRIVGNEAVLPATGASAFAVVDPGAADQRISARMSKLGASAATRNIRLQARIQDSQNFYCVNPRRSASVEGVSIWKMVANTLSLIAENTSVTPAAGDKLTLEVRGSELRAYLNDTLVASGTDATYASGPVGLYMSGAGQADGCAWDDVTIETRV